MILDCIEVEIESIAPLNEREEALVDNHSVLNVLNIIHGELTLLGIELKDDPDHMVEGQELCRTMIEALYDREASIACAARTDSYAERILAEVARLRSQHRERFEEPEIERSVANIRTLLRIWSVRAHEILARARHPAQWVSFDTLDLRKNFGEVFAAMAGNSRGRFNFVYERSHLEPRSYYVDLDFDTARGHTIVMPPVLVDVMRDLIANARKYTPPGGSILAQLKDRETTLDLVVQDNGRGIAEEELRSVVEYGRRGSNTSDVRTMGGGLGLTKAFLVTRRFSGRMWLASRLGSGTRIRITLPHPEAFAPSPAGQCHGHQETRIGVGHEQLTA